MPSSTTTLHVFVLRGAHAVSVLVCVRPHVVDPNGPDIIPPRELEKQRIAGKSTIYPDAKATAELDKLGKARVIESLKLCIDETGAVESVIAVKRTGSPAYDQELEDTMRTWKFKPWVIDGKPKAACTAFTFIYQRS